jgi:thiol-disulfide isomerase/thioredoxin
MLKQYFLRKSKFGLAIDTAILLLIIFLLIPATRKSTVAFMLKPTIFVHQAGLLKQPVELTDETYDWQLADLQGNPVVLSEFRGQVIFINYWATWCAPCLAEMGQLEKLHQVYGNKVQFLFVSNESKNDIQQLMDKKNLNLPVFVPHTQYPVLLESNVLPTSFLINKKGQLVMKKTGVAQWNSKKVKNILDNLLAE